MYLTTYNLAAIVFYFLKAGQLLWRFVVCCFDHEALKLRTQVRLWNSAFYYEKAHLSGNVSVNSSDIIMVLLLMLLLFHQHVFLASFVTALTFQMHS